MSYPIILFDKNKLTSCEQYISIVLHPLTRYFIFKDVREPIIEREMFEHVQELVKKQTKRRPPKSR